MFSCIVRNELCLAVKLVLNGPVDKDLTVTILGVRENKR